MNAAEADILRRARARISDPARWTPDYNSFALDPQGRDVDPTDLRACQWCADGSLQVEGQDEYHLAYPFIKAAAREMCFAGTVAVNDNGDHATVLRMFDRAIELAEADQ